MEPSMLTLVGNDLTAMLKSSWPNYLVDHSSEPDWTIEVYSFTSPEIDAQAHLAEIFYNCLKPA